jgi:nucleoside-diphosphate-sugar epimerase
MRIFLAGASGVIGVRLIPLLLAGGHEVAGMTRSADKAGMLRELGAAPVVCDVYDADALKQEVTAFGTELTSSPISPTPEIRSPITGTETTACARRGPAT